MTSAAYMSTYRARKQRATAAAARWREPWTPAEDAELLHGAGTVLERAVRLDRTYLACTHRLARLAEQGAPTS